MRLPRIKGLIRRRILVNFRVDPVVMQKVIPGNFRPKLLDGAALAGVCLIRLEQIRPRLFPAVVGISSENAAHRVAVEWTSADGQPQEGVYIPRRDSNSFVNRLVGGRLFPGEHNPARFDVRDDANGIDFAMRSLDGSVAVDLRGKVATGLPATSRFGSMAAASAFFEKGSLGYSETAARRHLDGVVLATRTWKVEPLDVTHVHSSYFSDLKKFPAGSVEFDCALLMRDIEHEWQSAPDLQRVA